VLVHVVIVGGGIFGMTAAIVLRRRGHEVTLLDPGPLPHPLAESTDVSKVIRMDYGADEVYAEMGERALDGWRRWNAAWPAPLFHETGVTFLSRAPMEPGGFEHDSFATLVRRGHRPERLDAAAIARRFPAYRPGALVDGYVHPRGGWAEASAVVRRLATEAEGLGVIVRGDAAVAEVIDGGVLLARGDRLAADAVVVAAGAWSKRLVPGLDGAFRTVGQPVFHLRPEDPEPYRAERFPVFGADIARTGYYGFPVSSSGPDGIVKIANHGVGVVADPEERPAVSIAQEKALREFLADTFPALAAAPIVHRRVCVYCDTADEHFWIDRDPERPWLVVATGGSGHAFKFAPLLGDLIADAVLGAPPVERFRWRAELRAPRGEEQARHHG
jgi:glycine/D-amino acid oxidase-like deaminating enzyme